MSAANVELVRSIYEAWAEGRSARAFIAEDVEYVNPHDAIEPGVLRGRKSFARIRDAYDDVRIVPERYLEAGDEDVVVIAKLQVGTRGLHTETTQGYVWTVRDGQAVRFRWFNDPAEALKAVGLQRDTAHDMTPEVDEWVRFGYDWVNREKGPAPEMWHDDGEYVNAREDPDAATHRGLPAIQTFFAGWYGAYPDLTVEPVESRTNGDRVFVWVRMTGHGAKSGLPLDMELAHVWTLEGGKIRRIEEYMDRGDALAAAGLAAP